MNPAACRRDLKTFVKAFWPVLEPGVPLQWSWHLDAVCGALQAMTTGAYRKLAICLPPRHGKSTLANALFPAWIHARDPSRRIMTATHSLPLSLAFSQRHRDLVRSQQYQAAFPWVRIRRDADLKSKWETTAGGFRFSGAVGSKITGHGGTLMIVDDPHDLSEIDRSQSRVDVANWYRHAWLNRRDRSDAPEIIIMQRSAVDDLVGEVANMGFRVLAIPALRTDDPPASDVDYEDPRQPGEALVESRITREELLAQQDRMGRHFHSVYQQDPRAAAGAIFERDWFGPPPADWQKHVSEWVRYWDMAATAPKEGTDPDWTAGVLMARLTGSPPRFVIADVVRVRATPFRTGDLMLRTAEADTAAGREVLIVEEQEPGSSGKEVVSRRAVALDEWAYQPDRKTGPKEERWAGLSVPAEAGRVHMLTADWNEAFLSEAEQAPAGRHDDQLDAAAGAYHFLCLRGRWIPSV